ncbi:MAG: hypothetical protein ACRD2J_11390 [Thermoanaerobaculia bacterium]
MVPIDRLAEIVHDERVEIGVIAVPAESAQEIYERLVESGVCAILNFAPAQLQPRVGVKLRNVDLHQPRSALLFPEERRERVRDVMWPRQPALSEAKGLAANPPRVAAASRREPSGASVTF